MTFAPDDFAGRPCVAGLNQMGHAVAGSAVVSVAPLPVAMLAICAWEVWQNEVDAARKTLDRAGATPSQPGAA